MQENNNRKGIPGMTVLSEENGGLSGEELYRKTVK
jgi:hypothetical protein